MIAALKEKTGRSLEEWTTVIQESRWTSHGQMVSGLKADHGVSHGYANQIALRVRGGTAPANDHIDEMFAKRPEAKAIYDVLLPRIQTFGGDVDLAPKKGYVSLRRSKQFAVLQPASGRLDVGLQLKGVAPEGRLEPSGSFNAMLSHRVRVSKIEEVDNQLLDWLKRAYESA
jgi:hypothetical protein